MLLEYEKAIFEYLRGAIPEIQRLMYADEEELLYIQGDLNLNSAYFTRRTEDWPLPKLIRVPCDIRAEDDPIRGDIRVIDYYLRTIDYTAVFIVEKEADAQKLSNTLRFYFSDIPYVIAHYDLGEELSVLNTQEFKVQFTGLKVETLRNHKSDKGAWRHITVNWRSWVPMRRSPILTKKLYRGFILAVNGEVFFARPENLMPEALLNYTVAYLNRTCHKVLRDYKLRAIQVRNATTDLFMKGNLAPQSREYGTTSDKAFYLDSEGALYELSTDSITKELTATKITTPTISGDTAPVTNILLRKTGEIYGIAEGDYQGALFKIEESTEIITEQEAYKGTVQLDWFDATNVGPGIVVQGLALSMVQYYPDGSFYVEGLASGDIRSFAVTTYHLFYYYEDRLVCRDREFEYTFIDIGAIEAVQLVSIANTKILASITAGDYAPGVYEIIPPENIHTDSIVLQKIHDFTFTSHRTVAYTIDLYYHEVTAIYFGTDNGVYKDGTHIPGTAGINIEILTILDQKGHFELWASGSNASSVNLVIVINLDTLDTLLIEADETGAALPLFRNIIEKDDRVYLSSNTGSPNDIVYQANGMVYNTGKAIPLEIQIDASDGYSEIIPVLKNIYYAKDASLEDYVRFSETSILYRLNAILNGYKSSHRGHYLDHNPQIITDIVTCKVLAYFFEWSDRVCQKTPSTRIGLGISGWFTGAAIGPDNKAYFLNRHDSEIILFRLEHDGTLAQVVQQDLGRDIHPTSLVLGQDGLLYIGGDSSSSGIWYLDNDNVIKQTNVTTSICAQGAIGQDGKLYFGNYRLEGQGQFVQITPGPQAGLTASIPVFGPDGCLYFSGQYGNAYWRLNNDGTFTQVAGQSGGFMSAAIGQNNKLYFVGFRYIRYLDTDGIVKMTNKSNFGDLFAGSGMGQDGKLYFTGWYTGTQAPGIWYLDDDDQVKQTSTTTGLFAYAFTGTDGRLYFARTDNVILRLEDDGTIQQWGNFPITRSIRAQDGEVYIYGTSGISRMTAERFTNNSLAKTLTFLVTNQGTEYSREDINLLDAFGSYPAITESQYSYYTESEVLTRVEALLTEIRLREGIEEDTELNSVILYSTPDCVPIRTYAFYWTSRICQQEAPHYFNNGKTLARILQLQIVVEGEITTSDFNLLSAFNTYSTITDETYARLDDTTVNARANAFITYVSALEGLTDYRVVNSVIGLDGALCPIPQSSYELIWSEDVCSQIYIALFDMWVKDTRTQRKRAELLTYADTTVVNTEYFNLLDAFSTYPAITEDQFSKMEEKTSRPKALREYLEVQKGDTIPEVNSSIDTSPVACPFPTVTVMWGSYVCQRDQIRIEQTNKTDGTFYFTALGQDGKLYFGGSSIGIWYLDNDGTIKQTNKTYGGFRSAAIGQDGKLYFGDDSTNNGVWYLDNDGTIKQTNKTDGYFYDAALGQDGKLYFCSSGIFCLTGAGGTTSWAFAADLSVVVDSDQHRSHSFSILNAFDSYPAITASQYADYTESEARTRCISGLEYILRIFIPEIGRYSIPYIEGNEPILDPLSSFCPSPTYTYELDWWTTPSGICQIKASDNTNTGDELSLIAVLFTVANGAIVNRREFNPRILPNPVLTLDEYRRLTTTEALQRGVDLITYIKNNIQPVGEFITDIVEVNYILQTNTNKCPLSEILCEFEWVDTICQEDAVKYDQNTGNSLAQNLRLSEKHDGIIVRTEIFSILDTFDSYPTITRDQYVKLTDAEVTARANSLVVWVVAQKGIQVYAVLNSALEQNLTDCPRLVFTG